MAYADDLIEIRDNLVTAIKSITANPKPTYSNGARSVSWGEYMSSLMSQLETVEARIARGTPVEVVTRVGPVR